MKKLLLQISAIQNLISQMQGKSPIYLQWKDLLSLKPDYVVYLLLNSKRGTFTLQKHILQK